MNVAMAATMLGATLALATAACGGNMISVPLTQTAVGSFNLTLTVTGALSADTTKKSPVAGATVVVAKFTAVNGDSMNVPSPLGPRTTDAGGKAQFEGLSGGAYTYTVTPPSGSPYVVTVGGIGPPTVADVSMNVTMLRQR